MRRSSCLQKPLGELEMFRNTSPCCKSVVIRNDIYVSYSVYQVTHIAPKVDIRYTCFPVRAQPTPLFLHINKHVEYRRQPIYYLKRLKHSTTIRIFVLTNLTFVKLCDRRGGAECVTVSAQQSAQKHRDAILFPSVKLVHTH